MLPLVPRIRARLPHLIDWTIDMAPGLCWVPKLHLPSATTPGTLALLVLGRVSKPTKQHFSACGAIDVEMHLALQPKPKNELDISGTTTVCLMETKQLLWTVPCHVTFSHLHICVRVCAKQTATRGPSFSFSLDANKISPPEPWSLDAQHGSAT